MRIDYSINKYGVTLTPLKQEDLDLVRSWRTSGKLDEFIGTKGYLSKEEQLVWFEKVNNDNNLYFIITIDDNKVGLIQANNLNGQTKTGFYIYDDNYQNTIYPYKIVIALHEILFDELKLKEIYCDIIKSNKRAVRFNKSLGFEYFDGQTYRLRSDPFYKKLSFFTKIINNGH